MLNCISKLIYSTYSLITIGKYYYILVETMNFNHLKNLEQIFHYQSPCNRYHSPREIKPNIEEIEVILSGHGCFKDGNKDVDTGPGSLVWFYPGDIVEVTSHKTSPYETIVFTFSTKKDAKQRLPMHTIWENTGECARFCRDALKYFSLGSLTKDYFVHCVYARLYWEASEYNSSHREENIPVPVRDAAAFIEEHFQEDISVADIADSAGVSASHLHLLFRTHLHISPFQLVLKHRLLKAQELLLSTNASVKEICFQTGFSDLKNFCTFFKQNNGKTPTQYRQIL